MEQRGSGMSEHHTGPVEVVDEMNNAEHEKTYNGFLALTKYGTMLLCVLMLAMVAGFFTTAGFLGGLVVFVVLSAAGFFLLR
jgi:NADH:ubiquinone oxidoreductase subunit 2 (subunit N)